MTQTNTLMTRNIVDVIIEDAKKGYPDYTADQLLTALEEGKLKGKLKEIVQHLDEEDNGVVMMLKRKK